MFAPTNEAFGKLDKAMVDALVNDPKALGDVLKFHVVSGKLMSAEVKDGEVATLLGPKLTLKKEASGVTVNGAKVVLPDLAGTNGVVHVHCALDYDTDRVKPVKSKVARRFSVEPRLLPLLSHPSAAVRRSAARLAGTLGAPALAGHAAELEAEAGRVDAAALAAGGDVAWAWRVIAADFVAKSASAIAVDRASTIVCAIAGSIPVDCIPWANFKVSNGAFIAYPMDGGCPSPAQTRSRKVNGIGKSRAKNCNLAKR